MQNKKRNKKQGFKQAKHYSLKNPHSYFEHHFYFRVKHTWSREALWAAQGKGQRNTHREGGGLDCCCRPPPRYGAKTSRKDSKWGRQQNGPKRHVHFCLTPTQANSQYFSVLNYRAKQDSE